MPLSLGFIYIASCVYSFVYFHFKEKVEEIFLNVIFFLGSDKWNYWEVCTQLKVKQLLQGSVNTANSIWPKNTILM